jgi:hypothetical protein
MKSGADSFVPVVKRMKYLNFGSIAGKSRAVPFQLVKIITWSYGKRNKKSEQKFRQKNGDDTRS